MIVSTVVPASLPGIDKLANEFDINFAIESRGDPKRTLAELQGPSNHVGVQVDVGNWLQDGIDPLPRPRLEGSLSSMSKQ
ncbi:MAG: hypothetical protein JWQ42_1770 [Edaphobacter sp.]|nr:hypothetical protein [Edaphobacter sp.]